MTRFRHWEAEDVGLHLFFAIIALALAAGIFAPLYKPQIAYGQAQTVPSSTVTVGNANPTVTNVVLNAASSIVLTANTTTNVNVTVTISDNNGCSDITSGTTTIMIFRSGVGSSSCMTNSNNLNCYRASAFTVSSTCSGNSVNATTTFAVWYFAEATDGSSTFSSQNWVATVVFKDVNNATGTGDAPGQELLTLTAVNVTTSTINYGTLSASSTSGSTNQVTTSTNAGNSSTTLRLLALEAMKRGAGGNLATNTTQTYSTSSFVFQGTSTFLTDTNTLVPGFLLTAPTSTTNVQQPLFWGITIPAGTATGTYTGTNLFTALYIATST